jgi:hypothetical protein
MCALVLSIAFGMPNVPVTYQKKKKTALNLPKIGFASLMLVKG